MESHEYCVKEAEIATLKAHQESLSSAIERIDGNLEKILGKLNNGINVALANVSTKAKENGKAIELIQKTADETNKNRRKLSLRNKIALAALIIANLGTIMTILLALVKPLASALGIQIIIK